MGHILEFLLVPNKFIKLGALEPWSTWIEAHCNHQEDTDKIRGSKLEKKKHKGPTISSPIIQISREARKRFESRLLSLCSSWGAPGVWNMLQVSGAWIPFLLGTLSPSVHLTLRNGLGQLQAVFLHVWHSGGIKGRGEETSQEPTILFSPRTG